MGWEQSLVSGAGASADAQLQSRPGPDVGCAVLSAERSLLPVLWEEGAFCSCLEGPGCSVFCCPDRQSNLSGARVRVHRGEDCKRSLEKGE